MALNGTYTKTLPGFPAVSTPTYVKVEQIQASKLSAIANVVFHSADKTIGLDTKQYIFTPSVATGATNFIEQAYVYLKTLPDFAGFTDC